MSTLHSLFLPLKTACSSCMSHFPCHLTQWPLPPDPVTPSSPTHTWSCWLHLSISLGSLYISIHSMTRSHRVLTMLRHYSLLLSVTKSSPTLFIPLDCSPPGSSVHGISQAGILQWIAISFSRGSSWLRDWMHISCTGRWILYHWATREAQNPILELGKANTFLDLL